MSFNFDEKDMAKFRRSIREELNKGVLDIQINSAEQELESNETISTAQEMPLRMPPRFSNPTATICWLNSILQMIILTMKAPHPNTQLRNLLNSYSTSEQIIDAQQMRDLLSDKYPVLRVGYQDPFDFFTAVALFDETEISSIMSPISLQMIEQTTCNYNALHVSDNRYIH